MKKLLLLLLGLLPALPSLADIFVVNDIRYITIDNSSCEVISKGDGLYSGNITIPASVAYNGSDYFVTAIAFNAFSGCTELISVSLPNSITKIEERAFSRCSLTSITIPSSVTYIGSYAFEDCSALIDINIEENQYFSSENGVLLNKEKDVLIAYPGGRTGPYAIPNSVTEIGDHAFYCCSGLTSVSIPNSVTSIGRHAFYDCTGLTSVSIPNSVTSISSHAFDYCTALTSITISNSVTSISDHSFSTCPQLTEVTIPNSVIEIGEFAFYGCSGLTSVTISNSATEIGASAFENCSALTSIVIPNSVSEIGRSAFEGCCSMESVIIGDHITEIGWNVFKKCSSLTSLTIPSSVTLIGFHAFQLCTSLKTLNIPNSVTSISECGFNDCTSLVSVNLPKSVASIGPAAFAGCLALENFSVSPENQNYSSIDGVLFNKDATTLVQYASGNPRTSYIVPNSVTEIGYGAFYGSQNLESIIFSNAVTKIGAACFNESPELKTIIISGNGTTLPDLGYVPFDDSQYESLELSFDSKELAEAAAQDLNWSKFVNIIYVNDGKKKISVQWDLPLMVGDSEDSNFYGCMAETGEALQLHSKYNKDVAMYVGDEEITYALNSPEGYTLTVDSDREKNRITVYPASKARTVVQTEAGSLFDSLGLQDLQNIEALTIVGPLNTIDIMAINRMVSLKYLNLKGATIVEGGDTNREEAMNVANTFTPEMFSGNKDLVVLIMPESVTEVAADAFGGLENLRTVALNSNIIELTGDMFANCPSLSVMNIPTSVKSIDAQTFAESKNLELLEFAVSNDTIAVNNGSLADVPLMDVVIGRPYAGQPFSGHATLTSVAYTNDLTIAAGEFANCGKLTSVKLPDGIIAIPDGVFSGCSSLETVKIGANVKRIADDAFAGCVAIKELHCYAPIPPVISEAVFADVDKKSCHLVVPQGSLVYYWLDPVWREFLNMSSDILYLSPLPEVVYGDEPVDLSKYAPEGVRLTYESSNPEVVRIDGTMATIIGAGEATIGAISEEDGTPMEIIGQMRQFFVDQADLTISVHDIEITEGESIPEFVYTATGLCYNDSISDISELPEVYCEAGPDSAPGEYVIELRGGSDKNYRINTAKAKLIIRKKEQAGIDSIEADHIVTVYTLQGIKINVTSIAELPAGIYIINGKKVKI